MLHTARLLLRPWRESEGVIQHRLWQERDPRVPPHRRISAEGRPSAADLEERIRAGAHPGLLALEIVDTGEVIGYCGLIENGFGDDGPELAFELFRRFWAQGYATEAATAVLKRAAEQGHPRVWATVREWNLASRRVLDKLGFAETGRVERDAVHGDSLFTVREL